ncbi:hypothetical protein [Actinomadura sp. GTD37]|uniref:hypothetical protein n=1 Tax=Actinomadura sp. GTD37 TaxID=1778030 RepID=UPI0035BF2105
MARLAHGPGCYACTDPVAAAAQLAAERAVFEVEAVRAREHRVVGEALDVRARDNLVAGRGGAAALLDGRALQHFQVANALGSGVRFSRAHLERVVAAHPKVAAGLAVLTDEATGGGV